MDSRAGKPRPAPVKPGGIPAGGGRDTNFDEVLNIGETMQAIQTALAILAAVRSLLPAIVQLVQDIEAAMPQPGQGSKKLDMARSVLQTAVGDMQGVGATFDVLWPALAAVIGAQVAIAKATTAKAA